MDRMWPPQALICPGLLDRKYISCIVLFLIETLNGDSQAVKTSSRLNQTWNNRILNRNRNTGVIKILGGVKRNYTQNSNRLMDQNPFSFNFKINYTRPRSTLEVTLYNLSHAASITRALFRRKQEREQGSKDRKNLRKESSSVAREANRCRRKKQNKKHIEDRNFNTFWLSQNFDQYLIGIFHHLKRKGDLTMRLI